MDRCNKKHPPSRTERHCVSAQVRLLMLVCASVFQQILCYPVRYRLQNQSSVCRHLRTRLFDVTDQVEV